MGGLDRPEVEALLGEEVVACEPLRGGCVAEVYRLRTRGGRQLVAKVESAGGQLHLEAAMLRDLAPHLLVPAVLHASPTLLLMDCLPGTAGADGTAEEHAAALLAALHGVTREEAGYPYDTLIATLPQPNPRTSSWLQFFAEQRLIPMARAAEQDSCLGAGLRQGVETLAGRLERFLQEPEQCSLLHGDVWSGNVLSERGKVTGFLDPAIYYGDPEVELAFIAMFHTFGERFFYVYDSLRGVRAGFWEERCPLYQLYPYLVHVRLFGAGYLAPVQRILARFG